MRAALLVTIVLLAASAAPASAKLRHFASPSKNISCYIDTRSVRCDIRTKTWSVPRPASCELDYGSGLGVDRNDARGYVVCAGDTALGAKKVLAYGKSIKEGRMTCTSRRAGMKCKNRRGHGFTLSRTSYELF